ncbi:hypothetical protein OIU78_011093 [Salix suchowensis]|nr:hypothetical protein OIU78_011093 [Salix suchowensis]
MRGLGGRERRLGDVSVPSINCFDGDDQKSESVPEFCIDAGSTGNIARFINHSCEPNLFVQCVLSSHHDVKLARVMLFAADNIPPMQELTYDYGYALDSVHGPSGKNKTDAVLLWCSRLQEALVLVRFLSFIQTDRPALLTFSLGNFALH